MQVMALKSAQVFLGRAADSYGVAAVTGHYAAPDKLAAAAKRAEGYARKEISRWRKGSASST